MQWFQRPERHASQAPQMSPFGLIATRCPTRQPLTKPRPGHADLTGLLKYDRAGDALAVHALKSLGLAGEVLEAMAPLTAHAAD